MEPITSQRSLAESETRLPCRYQVDKEEQVVQVTWLKEHGDGTKEQIITAHFTDGHTGRLHPMQALRAAAAICRLALQEFLNIEAQAH